MKKKSLQEPLDMSQPINFFFGLISDGVLHTSEANTPYMPTQVIKMSYHAISCYVISTDAYKDWRQKPSTDNT